MTASQRSSGIPQIDQWIRQGNGSMAQHTLGWLIQGGPVRREDAQSIAWLAWRASLPLLGIKILNRIVRPPLRKPCRATDGEKAEYAACLIKLGSADEALRLLKTLDPNGLPQVWLYQALALVSRWDYEATLPYLEKYLVANLDPYQRLVGLVNLAAAHVFRREHQTAFALLRELERETQKGGYTLLHGNVLELLAETFIFEKLWGEAESLLKRALGFLESTRSIHEFLVRKWSAIVSAFRSRGGRQSVNQLDAVRAEARKRQHWETIRECDYFEAITRNDPKLFLHLYFGTPFGSFRKRMQNEFPTDVKIPPAYTWHLKQGRNKVLIDLRLGQAKGRRVELKLGQTPHRLLTLLASDFYRPFHLGTLYAELFQAEVFNPNTSPPRVHQAIKLLRRWFSEQKIPLTVKESSGLYSLFPTRPCGIVTTSERLEGSAKWVLLERLALHFDTRPFSAKEASSALRMSERNTQRLLRDAFNERKIVMLGRRRGARYQCHGKVQKSSTV